VPGSASGRCAQPGHPHARRQGNPGQRTVVVGVGDEFRRDDGAGPEVIARLRALQPGDASLSGVTLALSDGEPSRMIDLPEDARLAVVVDAVGELAEQVREIVRW
jgi:Ni,Fe-hydrogenase maturation factor